VNAPIFVAVPPGVVTLTFCNPAPAGVTAVINVPLLLIKKEVAATSPTVTLVDPVKFNPIIEITVPPSVEPEDGVTVAMVGATSER